MQLRTLTTIAALTFLLAGPAHAAGAGAEADLSKALNAYDSKGAVKAIGELGDQGDEKATKIIIAISLKLDELKAKKGEKGFTADDENDIYDAAKAALCKIKDEKAHKYLMEQLKSNKDWRIREIIVDALAKKPGDDTDDVLISAVHDKSPIVAGTAIRALKTRKCGKAIDAIIEVLEKTEKKRDEPWLDAQTSLVELTGQDLTKSADWKTWWEANKKTFDAKKVQAHHGVGETVMREAPKLFGKEVLSKRVVFILDISGSMLIKDLPGTAGQRGMRVDPENDGYDAAPNERMRMVRLKEAMKECITNLPEDTKFTIIVFSTGASTWQPELVPATAKNKTEAVEYAENMVPKGFTWTDAALEAAFAVPDANTFYLFSDGIPQKGNTPDGGPQLIPTEEILDSVKEWNRLRKVKINTIGIGEADPIFMTKLAQQNDGTFTPVK